jgi:hypothetical protein
MITADNTANRATHTSILDASGSLATMPFGPLSQPNIAATTEGCPPAFSF